MFLAAGLRFVGKCNGGKQADRYSPAIWAIASLLPSAIASRRRPSLPCRRRAFHWSLSNIESIFYARPCFLGLLQCVPESWHVQRRRVRLSAAVARLRLLRAERERNSNVSRRLPVNLCHHNAWSIPSPCPGLWIYLRALSTRLARPREDAAHTPRPAVHCRGPCDFATFKSCLALLRTLLLLLHCTLMLLSTLFLSTLFLTTVGVNVVQILPNRS